MACCHSGGSLRFGRGMVTHCGIAIMVRGVRVLYGCGAVVMGTCGVTTLHLQEMVKPELPPLLEVLSNLSMESSRMFCSDGDPL
jgi:hypothetical protein